MTLAPNRWLWQTHALCGQYVSLQPVKLAELAPSLPDPLRAAQRDRLDRRRWVDPAACRQARAVGDEEIGDVVGLIVGIDHGRGWIAAHPRRAHQVPAQRRRDAEVPH